MALARRGTRDGAGPLEQLTGQPRRARRPRPFGGARRAPAGAAAPALRGERGVRPGHPGPRRTPRVAATPPAPAPASDSVPPARGGIASERLGTGGRRFDERDAAGAPGDGGGVLGGVLAGACAQGAPAEPSRATAALDPAARREITFWPRNAVDKIAFDAILPLARERFPNLTVTLDVPAGNILDKLKVSLAADTPPDSVVLSLTYGKHMAAQGAVLSLQEYLKADRAVGGQPQGVRPLHGAGLHLRRQAVRRPGDERGDRPLVPQGRLRRGPPASAPGDRGRPGEAGTGTPSRTWPAPSTGAAGSSGRGTA